MTDMNEETASRSNLLYSLLAGILHERGIQILKTVQDLNGFEARLISEELHPWPAHVHWLCCKQSTIGLLFPAGLGIKQTC